MTGGEKNTELDNNYIVVYGWMHKYLKLNGNEAEAFALIYSFHQCEGFYGGSSKYISERLYIPEKTAKRILQRLEKENFIIKEKGERRL